MKALRMLVVALGLAAGMLATAAEARAQGQYGSFVVRNRSNVTIYYQVQWGNGEWTFYSVAPPL